MIIATNSSNVGTVFANQEATAEQRPGFENDLSVFNDPIVHINSELPNKLHLDPYKYGSDKNGQKHLDI